MIVSINKLTKVLLAVGATAVVCVIASTFLTKAEPVFRSIAIDEMTWVEVRDARQSGYTTVIVPTGGLEQNGPHMAIGKHDYIVREAADRIAKTVGKTLVAPVVSFVPQGSFDPPTGHLRFPGTIGVTEQVFDGMLDGIARSLKVGGFRTICLIGDHGGSQAVQKAVADRLSLEWAKEGVRVVNVESYYDDRQQIARLLSEGHTLAAIGQHASLIDTSELMSIRPKAVDLARYRDTFFLLQSSGVSGDPSAANGDLGARLLEMRVEAAASQIKRIVTTPAR